MWEIAFDFCVWIFIRCNAALWFQLKSKRITPTTTNVFCVVRRVELLLKPDSGRYKFHDDSTESNNKISNVNKFILRNLMHCFQAG